MPDPLFSLIIAFLITAAGLFVFWPERGPFWRWQRTREMTDRVLNEDALKHIQQSEFQNEQVSFKSLAGALNISPNQVINVIANLESHNLLEMLGSEFQLTPSGRDYAMRIIRAHRIFERYLAEETGYTETDWHTKAQHFEHYLSQEEVEALSARLGHPINDPHGDPIPLADGTVVYPQDLISLTGLSLGTPARIVHIEDEPEAIYAQLVAEGLHIGQEVRLLEASPQRVRFWTENDEHVLAPILAANIAVVPVPEDQKEEELLGEPLTNLKPGQEAQITGLSHRIRRADRRRLMDLGLLPGTTIEVEMSSASGDPIAYRIRGALIALRKSQAELISVRPDTGKK